MRLWKGDEATRTRDPGRGGAVVGGFVGGIDGGVGHTSVAMVKGAVVELAVPVVFVDVLGAELIPEAEDAVRTRFRGVKVVLGTFEGSELVGRKVFREVFDWKAGKIVGHSMCFWSTDRAPFNCFIPVVDRFPLVGW